MGMPSVLTVNGTGTSAIWTPDWMQAPFSVACNVAMAGATGNLEATYDDLSPPTATASNWVIVSLSGVSFTTSLSSPVRGLRLNILTALSTGIVTATFIQATFPR